jgi:hypothetical protein
MAKRKAMARTRKAGRKNAKKVTRKASRPARKASVRKTARPKARTAARKTARKVASTSRITASRSRTPALKAARPKPVALSRPRRQLRDDETVRGAPSSLNFAAKASAAESGQAMYKHKKREHTEGGPALTGGDIDSDWNEAYASGEETPGGDMSTPDQDVVEEIGRALGVEYEDAEELKGAEKIESRDRNRWEYDPASAEDYKDRNRREE